jgi:hypothetical protein
MKVTRSCLYCGETINAGDPFVTMPHHDGAVVVEERYHRECLVRVVAGGVNHQLRRCRCCGGRLPPDPPGLTKREAALLAAHMAETGATR